VGPPPAQVSETPRAAVTPTAAARPAAASARLWEPVKYPPKAAILVDPDPGAAGPTSGDRIGVPFGTSDPQGVLHPILLDTLRIPVPAPVPPRIEATAPPPAPSAPPLVRVGGKVQPPAPLSTPPPDYPALARQTRVSGVVRLEAIIAADGTIRSVKLIQGPALLVQAAITAVRNWRYTPSRLNGEPVEILMYVDVNFRLGR